MRILTRRSPGKLLLATCAALLLALTPRVAHSQQILTSADTATGETTADSLRAGRAVPSHAMSPYASWVIVPDSTDRAVVTTMSELLQGRVPGLSVQRTSGASGAASRIRLRGTRSALASSTPLVIVDGLRVAVTAPDWGTFSPPYPDPGKEWASRLDDLDPEDVERVEVLGGPAAAARYGAGAAAGAIVITNKRGGSDGFHWAASGSLGTVEQRGSFPASFDQRGVDARTGEHIDYCGVDLQARHFCTALPDSLLRSNVLTTDSPFRTGLLSQFGVNGSAGSELGSIYIATDVTSESGAVRTNDVRRRHVLGHGVIHPFPSLSVGARVGYTRGSLSGSKPDDQDIFYSALISGPDDEDGYDLSPDTIAMLTTARISTRLIFGGTATWEPAPWLRITGTLGEDRNHWIDDQNPPSFGFGPDVTIWNRTTYHDHFKTARVEASSALHFGRSLRVTPSIGWDRLENKESGNRSIFNSFFSTTDPASYSGFARDVRIDGLSGRVDVAWRDRIALTGGFRREKSWRIDDQATYPMLGASWRLSAAPWFPRADFIDDLRLRAAYGEAGQSRRSLHGGLVFVPFFTNEDPDLAEPSTSETELGVDIEALHRRLSLSITHYRGNSDAWVVGYPALPFTPPPRYPGTIRSSGVEIGLSAVIFQTRPLSAGIDVAAAFPRTRYTGFPRVSGQQSMIPGYPVDGYWAPPILGYTDRNEDQIISTESCTPGAFPSGPTCEVALGERSYLGPSSPTREMSVRPRIASGRLTLSALFDYSGGNKLLNYTEYMRCQSVCRASQDARSSLGDQARAAAAALGSTAGFIEDAGYWKFRELSLTYAVPDEWAAALGAKRLSLALAARNLATWTRYGGPDPEVNSAGYESLASIDSFSQPAVRYLMSFTIFA